MYRTMQQNVFWEFDSILMQNVWGHFLLFCTPTWPSHHVDANLGATRPVGYLQSHIQGTLIKIIVKYHMSGLSKEKQKKRFRDFFIQTNAKRELSHFVLLRFLRSEYSLAIYLQASQSESVESTIHLCGMY